ncbi:MAG: tRNA epoxyqueuosine(34) reductase QueG [Bryobacteraceae bacterium]
MAISAQMVKQVARECGFDLAGIAPAAPLTEHAWYREWTSRGMAGEMSYLTDGRGDLRSDPRRLLPSARSVLSVGKFYDGFKPTIGPDDPLESAQISCYAQGRDYHRIVHDCLLDVVRRLQGAVSEPFEWKVCVDTAPLLERALARRAGLGWIGKNSCLIHEGSGSWFFLGEILLSLDLDPDTPPPGRCGSCRRCIDACPAQAIVPTGRSEPAWAIDSRRCISYLTIELRGPWPEELRGLTGNQVFGCDICQTVCPWNRRAPEVTDGAFKSAVPVPLLSQLASLDEEGFRRTFRATPVLRAKHNGFQRNVATAMGNSRSGKFRAALERMAASRDPAVSEHARWAIARIGCAE